MSISRIDQLRELILKPDKDRLEGLGERIESTDLRAADIAEVLPQSISDSYSRDTRLIGALRGPLRQCISESVRDEPDEYAAALFPIMGPAIRRSITETLRAWTQQFSQVIEQSLSPQGLRWRFQAWRAGVPFGQYVIQQTLIYRVEDVYLIHPSSGLLIAHVTQSDVSQKDEDAVSAMFTAIQSFVNDSFARGHPERLTTAELDDLTLWAVHGPNSTIVAVIRGVAPIELRGRLETAIERIERNHGFSLKNYSGDRGSLTDVEPELEACLVAATRDAEGQAKRPIAAMAVAIAIVTLLGAWIGYGFWMSAKTSAVADALLATPGIVLTALERDGNTILLSGLRDRLANDPTEIAREAGWNGEIRANLQPFLSLDDALVTARAISILNPPAEVMLNVTGGTLVLAGTATSAWIDETGNTWERIAGIDRIDTSQLSMDNNSLLALVRSRLSPPPTVALSLSDGIVVATGEAPQAWLDSVSVTELPAPIRSVDASAVAVAEELEIAALADQITQTIISFDAGGDDLSPASLAAVQVTASLLADYGALAASLGRIPLATISGHSDDSGSDQFNRGLEIRRASAVASALVATGIPSEWLTTRSQLESATPGTREPVATLELVAVPSTANSARD